MVLRKVSTSTDAARLQTLPQTVVAFSRELAHDELLEQHSHPRGQLLYAVDGVMQVRTPQGLWVIPPQRALWVPPHVAHEIRMLSKVSMRTLYMRQEEAERIGLDCLLLEVSGLLRELILALLAEASDYDSAGRGGHLAQLILSEIQSAERIALSIPWPRDRRLLAICEALLHNPGSPNALEDWAAQAGASPRTLIRLFPKETGLHFRHWLQQVQISDALLRLARGESVERIAQHLGYRSTSAFSSMFRRVMGKTPGHYAGEARARRY